MVTINESRDAISINTVILVEVTLKNSGGTHYFCDRENGIKVSGQRYEDYIGNSIQIGNEARRSDSSGKNANIAITFKNDPYETYGYLINIGETYPFEDADVTIKEINILRDGSYSDVNTLFVGSLDSPRAIDNEKFTCIATSSDNMESFKLRL